MIANEAVAGHVLKINQHLVTCPATILSHYLVRHFDDLLEVTKPQIAAVVEWRSEVQRHLDRLGLTYLPGPATFYLFVSIADSSLGSDEFCTRLFERAPRVRGPRDRLRGVVRRLRPRVGRHGVQGAHDRRPRGHSRPRRGDRCAARWGGARRSLMDVLITGATGFIGRHLIEELTPRHCVYALARRGAQRPGPAGVQWIEHDLSDDLPDTLPSAVDAVIHLAQSQAYRDFPEGAPDVFAVNVASTFALLDYAQRASARSFVLASTGGIYDYGPTPIDEDAALAPSSHYFRSKYAAELLMESYADLMATIALRFCFVYGPGQRGMLIPRLVERICAGDTVTIEGNPGLAINPIHVDDAVRVFEPALSRETSGVFNVAGDEVVTVGALVRTLAKLCGAEARVAHVATARRGDLVAANGKMKDELGVEPRIALDDGLRDVVGELRTASSAEVTAGGDPRP